METTQFTALSSADKRDLLISASSTLPYALGYFPEDSFIVIGLNCSHGTDVLIGPVARLDLDDIAQMWPRELADTLQPIMRFPLAACLVVVTTEHIARLSDAIDVACAEIDRKLAVIGTVVIDDTDVVVNDDEGGHSSISRTMWESTPEVMRMVVEGRTTQDSLDSFALPEPSAAAVSDGPEAGEFEPSQLRTFWSAIEQGVASREMHVALACAMLDRATRDTVIASLIERGDSVPSFVGYSKERINEACIAGPPRSTKDFHHAYGVFARLAHHVRGPLHAAMCGIAGYLSWYAGDGVRARILTDQCLATDANYSLALLVRAALSVGMPPPWKVGEQEAFRAAS